MKRFQTHIVMVQVLLFIGLTSYVSCGMKAQQLTSEVNQEQGPKLLFLNYSISKTNSGKKDVSFINKVIADGRLKDMSNKQPLSGLEDITCIQFDKNKVAVEQTYVKNPLKPVVEYVNDDGELEKRQLDLDTAQFSIKLQLDARTSYITLFLMDTSGAPSTELITTSIQ